MKIDVHVHSRFSMRPSQWILKKIGCPESFTSPHQIYRIAKKRGMTHVTITDHNSIDGALEIAHLPDTFISEEVTSYFPDDPCKVHVLTLDITEAQHEDIQKARQNIFDLVSYLNKENILHILAHPLYPVNDRLTLDHVEKFMVLFKHLELNGARNERENSILRRVVNNLTPGTINRLADKHGIEPLYDLPHEKILFGGSDDHSSLNIARTHTEFPHTKTIEQAFGLISPSSLHVNSLNASPLTMAHNFYGIAYQFYLSKVDLERYTGKDVLLRFLDRTLRPESEEPSSYFGKPHVLCHPGEKQKIENPLPGQLMDLIRKEMKHMFDDRDMMKAGHEPEGDDLISSRRENEWFDFVNTMSGRVMLHLGNNLLDQAAGIKMFSLFHTLGSAGGFYTLLAPYFVAYSQFTKDKNFGRHVLRSFSNENTENDDKEPLRLAHFTDTFTDVNGVAITLNQHVTMAKKYTKNLILITCGVSDEQREGVKQFTPTGQCSLPEYSFQNLSCPPFLEMLDYCYQQGFNQIHTSTPGPMGLAALAIGKILNIPVSGTYHTQIPQFAKALTGDTMIEDLAWKYILWYYDQMDRIFAPSNSTAEELTGRGIDKDKIRVYPRGIDIDGFHPKRCQEPLSQKEQRPWRFLYVGRVSKEKNMHILEEAFARLFSKRKDVALVVAGDGPYLEDMKASIGHLPVHFTGYISGDYLRNLYAACDIFVFPSTTDTFGNVILEAQASGLPVIVTDRGGPIENMIPDVTGKVVCADDIDDLIEAMDRMSKKRTLANAMGKAGRVYMEGRSFDQAFLKTWELYKEVSFLEGGFKTPPQDLSELFAEAV